jgi:hypothetical protein
VEESVPVRVEAVVDEVRQERAEASELADVVVDRGAVNRFVEFKQERTGSCFDLRRGEVSARGVLACPIESQRCRECFLLTRTFE